MAQQKIVAGDWHRILIGDAPATFLIEVFFRTIVIYVLLLLALRTLGKRMTAQLTIAEMAVMLTLGGIVSLAMQMPDKGVVLGILVLVCALVFQRGLTWWEVKNQKVERFTQGKVSLLAANGVLDLAGMQQARVSREQLFSVLRAANIFNLGRVRRVYLEACGEFSVFQNEEEQPGLSTLPPSDRALRDRQRHGAQSLLACARCGLTAMVEPNAPCTRCGHEDFQPAVLARDQPT